MRVVYGTKAITEDDLFDGCGRPRNILEFINKNLEDVQKNLNQAIWKFEYQGYQSDFRFDFIPLELIEEYILCTAVSKSAEIAMDFMATRGNIDRSKHIAIVADEKLEAVIDKYTNTDSDEYKDICDAVCAAIIYDPIFNNTKDICVCVPRQIISKIETDMEYCCSRCGSKQYTSELPDMMYTIDEGNIIYYCKKCCNSDDVVSFVGDYWPPKE